MAKNSKEGEDLVSRLVDDARGADENEIVCKTILGPHLRWCMCTSLTFDKIMMVGAMSQLAMACITLCSPSVVMGVSLPHPSSTHPLFPWEMSNVRALSPSPQVVTPMHVHGAVMEMHAWLGRVHVACFIAGHTRNRERARRILPCRPLRDLSSKRIDGMPVPRACEQDVFPMGRGAID